MKAISRKTGFHHFTSSKDGFFDAWSTPVCIKFVVEPSDATTTIGGGVYCLERLLGVSLNRAGYMHPVRHLIHSIRIDITTYDLYRNLGDALIREKIQNGELIMCTARWCDRSYDREALARALVCQNRNPCGRIVAASDYWDQGWRRSNTKRYFCPQCRP